MIAMTLEDGLELLREYDIRVVHARVVDSSEDAVAFASGRTIDLCALSALAELDASGGERALQSTSAIHHAYRRLERRVLDLPDGRVLARRTGEGGTDVIVEARDDVMLGRIVEIRGGTHFAHRLLPLGETQAEAMLAEFHAKHGVASSGARTRMLAHLLLRVSEIVEDEAVERIVLDPVRVHDNSYDVLAARIDASRPLELNRRLGRHAHDRHGMHAPSGQK